MNGPRVGKTLYGILFLVLVPGLLVLWARLTEQSIKTPAPTSRPIGIALAVTGATIMISGMAALMVFGKGLPMNAYPPPRYVKRGIFRIISHPIYLGFSIICVGVAVATASASGLWLVTPVVILGCVALVEGYEKHDLSRRFGAAVTKPIFSLSPDEAARPKITERSSVYFVVFLPWVVLYEMVRFIGILPGATTATFSFETRLPVYEWTEIIYASTYAFVLAAPLMAKTGRDLRRFSIWGLMATALIILLFLCVPLIAPPRPFTPHTVLGNLLAFERAHDTPAAAFPSFHVLWAFLAATAFITRMPSLKILWWGWAVLISLTCVTTGMHAIVDVIGGFLVFLLVRHDGKLWGLLLRFTERMANSWKEWRIGPLRIINHGFYAGLAGFVAFSIMGTLAGPSYTTSLIIISICGLVTSAIWGQLLEGSSSLLRPYGWYGGVIGAIVGVLISTALGANRWMLFGAFSVGAPWAQAIGRLRCLVQGCCHGGRARNGIGIRYAHPRSRVSRLAGLANLPIHATPLYSILGNIIIGVVMLKVWTLNAPLSLVLGLYLILSGLARFVEESYRGEPHTKIIGGLRIYQWLAIASVVAGMAVTMISGTPAAPLTDPNWSSIIGATGVALFAWFLMGVDFPQSNKRFARLA